MKLLYCLECGDLRKLHTFETFCLCGKSCGWYDEDGVHAGVRGKAIVIGIDNHVLAHALRLRQQDPTETYSIAAWLMRDGAPHVEREP